MLIFNYYVLFTTFLFLSNLCRINRMSPLSQKYVHLLRTEYDNKTKFKRFNAFV